MNRADVRCTLEWDANPDFLLIPENAVNADRDQLLQLLSGRCDAIAEQWRNEIAPTSFVRLSVSQVLQRFAELAQNVVAVLLSEPFDPAPAQNIGKVLVQLHYVQPESLQKTQSVLGRYILEGLAPDQVALLSPRLVALLSELAAGFLEQARQVLLDEQEQIRRALVAERQRAEDEVRELNKTLVRRVIERTEQFEVANQELEKQIAARKRILETLQDTTQALQAIIQSSPLAIIVTDSDGIVKMWNPAAERIFGWTASEVIGQPLPTVPPDKYDEHMSMREMAKKEGFSGMQVRRRRKDGALIDTSVSVAGLYDTRGELTGYLALIADITERTQAEAELRESEERYRALFETSADAIFLETVDGKVLDCNASACQMYGYSKEELLALTVTDLVPEQVAAMLPDVVAQELATGGLFFETLNRRKSGQVFPCEISTRLATIRGETLAIVYVRDITERRRAEDALRQYTSELQARNEELDAFTHTVAHDLKNPLANIIAFADEMQLEYDSLTDEERVMCVRTILNSGRKLDNILEELILLAGMRRTLVKIQPLDMGSIVTEALQRLSYMLGRSEAQIVVPDASAWPRAIGHAPWVEEVWVNYISNAIKYGGKPPRVELGGESQPDGTARFWVRDNGNGLTPEQQARLFTPFTQLTEVRARGHGLGLSIVRRIVDRLNGQVGVESHGVPGAGSLFYFTLPAHQANSAILDSP